MESSAGPIRKNREDPLRYLRISTTLSFAQGQTIYSPGDPATNIYLVISGKVKVGRVTNNGREIVINVYQTDDVFGISALIESHRSGRALALENTKVMVWTAAQIETIGLESPKLLYALLQMMTARMQDYEDRIESFIVDDVRRRLARTLIEFSKDTPVDAPGGPARMAPLTHELLSSYIGTSREVITQFMNRFRRLGYLSYSRKGILVYRDRMQRLLGEADTSADSLPRGIGPARATGRDIEPANKVWSAGGASVG